MATATKQKEYTLDEIDHYLGAISNIIRFGKRTNKEKAFDRADEWLDKRLELAPVENNDNG